MQTAKRATARERLAAKRAHNWEQQYHGEIDPLRQEVKRQAKEIEIYQKMEPRSLWSPEIEPWGFWSSEIELWSSKEALANCAQTWCPGVQAVWK